MPIGDRARDRRPQRHPLLRLILLPIAGTIAAGAILLAPVMAGRDTAAAQGVVKSVYGEWESASDAARRAERSMRADAERHRGRLAQCGPYGDRAETADQKSRLMRVVAPLGILLPSGLGLKITIRMSAAPASSNACPTAASPEIAIDDTDHCIAQRSYLDLHHLNRPRKASASRST